MRTGTRELARRARTIFDDLGYTVRGDGAEFRAERAGKVVRVTATDEEPDPPEAGGLHCFVAPGDRARSVRRRLARNDPDCEWAIIGVRGDDYEVERAPPGPEGPT